MMRLKDFPIMEEIKTEYIRLRCSGLTRAKAEKEMQSEYYDELYLGCEDDGLLFWIGLADAQYYCKELSSESAKNALEAVMKLQTTSFQKCTKDLEQRKINYACAPMPERKPIKEARRFRCTWKIGDTFAYMLSGPEAEKRGISGAYMIIRKVDELESFDGRLLPIVTFTMWGGYNLPSSSEEYQNRPLLIISKGRLNSSYTQSEYRAKLLIKNKKKLDQLNLIFLGNFNEIQMPKDELIIRDPGCIWMTSLDHFMQECCTIWDLNQWYVQHLQG